MEQASKFCAAYLRNIGNLSFLIIWSKNLHHFRQTNVHFWSQLEHAYGYVEFQLDYRITASCSLQTCEIPNAFQSISCPWMKTAFEESTAILNFWVGISTQMNYDGLGIHSGENFKARARKRYKVVSIFSLALLELHITKTFIDFRQILFSIQFSLPFSRLLLILVYKFISWSIANSFVVFLYKSNHVAVLKKVL